MSLRLYPGKSTSEQSNHAAFAALLKNGGLAAWGSPDYGGDVGDLASQLSSGVVEIYSNYFAFAAVKSDGSVVAWGDSERGGSSDSVAGQLQSGVLSVSSTDSSFAALKSDGSVVIWGKNIFGAEPAYSQGSFDRGAIEIYSTDNAFAILKSDGSVATWGSKTYGGKQEEASGDNSNVQSVESLLVSGVDRIRSTGAAFAAIKNDGSVVAWGNFSLGGYVDSNKRPLVTSGVQELYSNYGAFAALKDNGSVVTWGYGPYGGNSSAVESSLAGGVKEIVSTYYAFAAIKDNGTVVTWGSANAGGDSSPVLGDLTSVQSITASFDAFAALRSDGSVVTWGSASGGGDSSSVADQLVGVAKIVSGRSGAFAALRNDGTVVTWGLPEGGGDSAGVQSLLINVIDVKSNGGAFAALRDDGSVISWGNTAFGGSTIDHQIRFDSGVAGIANIATQSDRLLMNTAPTDLSITTSTLDESIAGGTAVGILSTTDANAGETFTYVLVSGAGDADNAAFTISGNQLKINRSPDYEAKPSYSIRVRTTDSGGLSFDKTLEFTVQASPAPITSVVPTPTEESPVLGIQPQEAVATIQLTRPISVGNLQIAQVVVGTQTHDLIIGSNEGEFLTGRQSRDQLTGGGGPDAFLFETPGGFGRTSADVVTDFDPDEGDVIAVSREAFIGLNRIKFKPAVGKREVKQQSRSASSFVYDVKLGTLYYDANGKRNGWGDGGEFAQLLGAPAISKSEFVIL